MSFGTQIFSVGDLGRKAPLENYIQGKRIHSGRDIYKKLYFLDGKLAGGIFIGDNRKVQALVKAVRSGASGEEAEKLLEE
jgi:NAD(P)H-nitrite reductase large subunit